MRILRLAVLLLACVPLVSQAGAAVMKDPVTVEITTEATAAQVRNAVNEALLHNQFTVDNERPGYLEGKFTRSNFWFRIAVTYDANLVTMQYVISQGLRYGEDRGRRLIHPNYNTWLAMVAKEIPGDLKRSVAAAR